MSYTHDVSYFNKEMSSLKTSGESVLQSDNSSIKPVTGSRYYATFKVRLFEYLLQKINTCLQKTSNCIGLQVEQKGKYSL